MSNSKVETVTGRMVDVLAPDSSMICLEDIAWSLSRIARYNGHTVNPTIYSVGQHSIYVSDMIFEETSNYKLAMYGLLHDSAEGFLGDIISPIKHIPTLHEVIEPIEQNLLNVIFDTLVCASPSIDEWNTIKFFDKKAQFIEAYWFMHSRGKCWENREKFNLTTLDYHKFPSLEESLVVYSKFLSKFTLLKENL